MKKYMVEWEDHLKEMLENDEMAPGHICIRASMLIKAKDSKRAAEIFLEDFYDGIYNGDDQGKKNWYDSELWEEFVDSVVYSDDPIIQVVNKGAFKNLIDAMEDETEDLLLEKGYISKKNSNEVFTLNDSILEAMKERLMKKFRFEMLEECLAPEEKKALYVKLNLYCISVIEVEERGK